ncbi:hypothetical protein [Calothrix sp. UHCC 0171]|nr:hypothetical protein [Calothrix sp. UHCC 0171]MEA5569480.1 hypothetical protein [Calothrix sp. UHCC 0171]
MAPPYQYTLRMSLISYSGIYPDANRFVGEGKGKEGIAEIMTI